MEEVDGVHFPDRGGVVGARHVGCFRRGGAGLIPPDAGGIYGPGETLT